MHADVTLISLASIAMFGVFLGALAYGQLATLNIGKQK